MSPPRADVYTKIIVAVASLGKPAKYLLRLWGSEQGRVFSITVDYDMSINPAHILGRVTTFVYMVENTEYFLMLTNQILLSACSWKRLDSLYSQHNFHNFH